jgi:flavorubredoxin
MKARQKRPNIHWVGAIDWDRRLFDSLIPLHNGTSYNAYLVQGSQKVALIDTVDPSITGVLMSYLEDVPVIDYVIANHAEQDHSGSYGWGSKTMEQLTVMVPNIKAEVLAPVIIRGFPREEDFQTLDNLANTIAEKHRERGFAASK